ncbi:heavy metal translocating P-type ATPase metal-binding domain-containing protein [Algoriphagus sp.]|uniref:heavy metal translocating P-type ATPase n=1 Tax=Algoriphagus sp. TaxID=1872435 RepID=UPI0026224334|nr:heavy metal translocating P-type ATPase metal-binding domain-containing protein [Algoriphagus sp.]
MPTTTQKSELKCYHCGEQCEQDSLAIGEKIFCCQGCKLVFEVLAENNLCTYYDLESFPGESQKSKTSRANRFDYLEDQSTVDQLLDFKNERESHVSFYIPLIHCASCIWLLENLYQVHQGIISSRVDFIKKKVQVKFLNEGISLKELVGLLSMLGYEPKISLAAIDQKKTSTVDRRTVKRLAVAGFCFGNMMLFSIPEYFSEAELIAENFRGLFNYLNVILALPVVLYSASDYYLSAWNAFKQRQINMDVPIVLGIIALFFYSLWEIFALGNGGYMDSLGGLLFFLLLGKVYQQKTFATLEFDRDYKSYFPIAVTRLVQDREEVIPVTKLEVGDLILVRDEELIPADSLLMSSSASIDYSFVTGEEVPVLKRKGELIYAGGKQKGEAVILTVQKSPSQGYLTDLWNNEAFEKGKEKLLEPLSNRISGVFTWTVLIIATGAFGFWASSDMPLAVKAFTSVLIVACPCALAMSTPFTLGNSLRIFGRSKFYLKNASVVERMALIDTVVFDKTGTLTDPKRAKVDYQGDPLSEETKSILKSLVSRSSHPLSHRINFWLGEIPSLNLDGAEEQKGKGIQAYYKGQLIRLGSAAFTGFSSSHSKEIGNYVYLVIEGFEIGYFRILSGLRAEAGQVVKSLDPAYELHLLSGDHPHEQASLKEKLGPSIHFNFLQSPSDKLDYLGKLNQFGRQTLMVGDGLNDAGAIQKSRVGVALTDTITHFSPASDAILDATAFHLIPNFLGFAKQSRKIIKLSFGLSFLYNVAGVSLAVQGILSPVICAVLMPLSSISVVVFTTLATNVVAWKRGLLTPKNN